ncbi:MAG: hypothetical protein O2910_02080 [Proteobacteria bacterium]|nr:hypothetical protein [Pseudomonadota bacterium]
MILRYTFAFAFLVVSFVAATALMPLNDAPEYDSVLFGPDVAKLYDPSQLNAALCGPKNASANNLSSLVALFSAPAVQAAVTSTETPPLWDGLGDHSMEVTTVSEQAQAYFDQGLRLTFGFNHAEAIRAYKEAQRLDPDCAMCFWGEALALGPNINAPMEDWARVPALAAVAKAQAASEGATDKEKALINALAARYSDAEDADRSTLDLAYAMAMKEVHGAYPDDQDIAAFYAESAMDIAPWDYWEADWATPKGEMKGAFAAIETVLAANPAHAGAIHLYIHITEASVDPWRAESYADTLRTLMPAQGHLVHMPSHTYYRIGRFRDSVEANLEASAADEAYIEASGAQGVYPGGYYPHNVHFVLTSAQMAGSAEHAIPAAGKLASVLNDDVVAAVPWVQPVKAAPYLAHAQMSDAATILAQPAPPEQFPYVMALYHYARALGQVKAGDYEAAATEAARIVDLRDNVDHSYIINGGVPAKEVLTLASRVVQGRIAQAQGQYDDAADHFRAAVEIEDSLAYTEPPYWYYPVRQSLGAALLQAGRTGEAQQVFREELIRHPNNGWALWGLSQAYKAGGDLFAASQMRELYENAWMGAEAPTLGAL